MAAPSTLPRILLGLELKALREGTDIRMDEAAIASGMSKPTLWRIETGQDVRLNHVLIEKLCQVYDATPKQTEAVLELAREATGDKGWWHEFSDAIPKDFNLFFSLENAASRLISYQTTFVPGLLHTLEYRRSISWIEFPDKPPRETERMLQAGMMRQGRLTTSANPLELTALIDETVLRRMTGSAAVMADQLRHLADMAALPNVSIRVVPSSAGTYRGLVAGTFVLFEFPRHPKADLSRPPIVYVQGFAGSLYLKTPDKVAEYRAVCADIERLALDEDGSRQLIREIAEEFAI
ncbi:helix-turn-helix domain-containing protein [Nocardia otitidiscaviarum]|uniref:helix-turn-helix domain-containing protein n=1 Tax=Nocardia otitidiscaviarum TaxID=1823 RepID=UPI0004A77F49|nr:helix-turn-helix transcriptional regulator [Nocardia otitidiscaviarum]MBF6133808.1 helix-turn-helix domain-containing protein [Nocardia otitidiscaviarum]MBF6487836.1 helix-turn-helix domain-containing protein [Nocardia otitidiscaviarum]